MCRWPRPKRSTRKSLNGCRAAVGMGACVRVGVGVGMCVFVCVCMLCVCVCLLNVCASRASTAA